MLSKITRGNQVTIPKAIADRIGFKAGRDYVEIVYENGIICLKPVSVEERIPDEVLEKFAKSALCDEPGDVSLTPNQAQNFLAARAKKKSK